MFFGLFTPVAGLLGASFAPYIATWLAGTFGLAWVGGYLVLVGAITLGALLVSRETRDDSPDRTPVRVTGRKSHRCGGGTRLPGTPPCRAAGWRTSPATGPAPWTRGPSGAGAPDGSAASSSRLDPPHGWPGEGRSTDTREGRARRTETPPPHFRTTETMFLSLRRTRVILSAPNEKRSTPRHGGGATNPPRKAPCRTKTRSRGRIRTGIPRDNASREAFRAPRTRRPDRRGPDRPRHRSWDRTDRAFSDPPPRNPALGKARNPRSRTPCRIMVPSPLQSPLWRLSPVAFRRT